MINQPLLNPKENFTAEMLVERAKATHQWKPLALPTLVEP